MVSVHQLYAAGLTPEGVRRRVQAGRLHRLFRGVYAVGHAGLSNEGRWTAAILACGEGAALSHRSAAELWGMLEPADGPVQVTVPVAGGRSQRAGIRIHRSPYLTNMQTTRCHGIALTTAARTLTDLRQVVSASELRRAIREAEFAGLPIGEHGRDSDRTRSELERRFLRLCRCHRLPVPEVNVRVARFVVDFLWREQRLIVETDGYASHRGHQAFEDDHARDNELMALRYDVLRFTYWRVVNEPGQVAALVRARLNRAGSTGYSRYA